MRIDKATVLGIMSGSSLDGLDVCLTCFHKKGDKWRFRIESASTIELPTTLAEDLAKSPSFSENALKTLDQEYGEWIAKQIQKHDHQADVVGIHGHTVFHNPNGGISLQIGNPQIIAEKLQTQVVADFRNLDIELGGQGAPLVPMGERLLFPDFDAFINLGGICNASFNTGDKWAAGDIGPFNQVFNYFARKLGQGYDESGKLARQGNLIPELFEDWSSLKYFSQSFPKSLSNQWVIEHFLSGLPYDSKDVLHTFSHFIASEMARLINAELPRKVMISGGGAFNSYFIEILRKKSHSEFNLPDIEIIEYKEALIFGLLGLLKSRNETNVMSQCTGASRDSSSGVIYKPSNV